MSPFTKHSMSCPAGSNSLQGQPFPRTPSPPPPPPPLLKDWDFPPVEGWDQYLEPYLVAFTNGLNAARRRDAEARKWFQAKPVAPVTMKVTPIQCAAGLSKADTRDPWKAVIRTRARRRQRSNAALRARSAKAERAVKKRPVRR